MWGEWVTKLSGIDERAGFHRDSDVEAAQGTRAAGAGGSAAPAGAHEAGARPRRRNRAERRSVAGEIRKSASPKSYHGCSYI